jgi:hypothetical protein
MTVFIALTAFIFICNSSSAVCIYSLPGDLNSDCKVDLIDVSMLAANWLTDCNESPLDPACVDHALEAQKAQFHAIEVGLDLFKSEYGTLPASSDNETITFPTELGNDSHTYLGANKLAEGMVGMDLMGFHPNSFLRSDGLNVISGSITQVYAGTPDNLAERTGPFVDLEIANAYRLEDIFEDVGSFNGSSLVLCDVFEKERHSGKRTGMPILYFRARSNYTEQDYTDGIEDDIYYYPDNQALLHLGSAEDQTIQHPLNDGTNDWQDFESMILNPNITVVKRPYRSDTFILVSAGHDGLYGTDDDIFNFDP